MFDSVMIPPLISEDIVEQNNADVREFGCLYTLDFESRMIPEIWRTWQMAEMPRPGELPAEQGQSRSDVVSVSP
jgi:hypothetical protein